MREFLSISVVVTICFLATDAVFMDGQYRAEMWKDVSLQINDFSRSARKVALGLVN